MAEGLRTFFAGFRTIMFLILLHLGCIFFFCPAAAPPPPPASSTQHPQPKRRKISPLSLGHHQFPDCPAPAPDKRHRSLSLSIRSYLAHLFCFSSPTPPNQSQVPPPFVPAPGQQQLRHHLLQDSDDPNVMINPSPGSPAATKAKGITNAVHVKRTSSFASREDVFPCAACGEVFSKTHLLDLHQATRHAFSELSDGDSGRNIVHIIFQSGWKGRAKGSGRSDDAVMGAPIVHRILKIHNSPKTVARFEEYRESVRSRAAARWASGRGGGGDERCVADGNERLRFHCATFLCGLGREGNLGTCGSPFCSACGIVRHGFSGKDADGIATHGTGWGAHASLPEELEREFEFMHVRRAMLVCRVVAGRVGLGKGEAAAASDEEGDDRDSVVMVESEGGGAAEDVLVVFNPRAVLPCFVIIYSV